VNDISSIRFCMLCGAQMELQKRYGRKRPVCPACGHIHFIEPRVVAAVLVERDGQVLLVRRMNRPEQGKWALPAGFIDAGEDPGAAAVREVFEETGLQIRITDLLDVIAGDEHPRSADIIIIYRGEIEGGRLTAGDDADAAAFFDYGALPELAFTSTKSVIEEWHRKARTGD
jgi:ADP-ribose pyrophosphatase YjhB (NUDIX family)